MNSRTLNKEMGNNHILKQTMEKKYSNQTLGLGTHPEEIEIYALFGGGG